MYRPRTCYISYPSLISTTTVILSTIVNASHSIATMQNENETRCNFCNLSFRSVQQRNKHFTSYSHQVATAEDMVAKNPTIALGTPLTSTAAGKRSCQLCNLQFLTKPIRDLHVRTSQRHKELFGCGTCNQGFQDQGDLSKHMRTVLHNASVLAAQKLNLSAPPILQHAPQEASNTTSLPVQYVHMIF